jgi:hypothetical protein
MPNFHHQAARFLKYVYQQTGPYTQASPVAQAMLQASLGQLVQNKDLWSLKVLPDEVLDLMEEVPLADGTQYLVPLTEAVKNGECCPCHTSIQLAQCVTLCRGLRQDLSRSQT